MSTVNPSTVSTESSGSVFFNVSPDDNTPLWQGVKAIYCTNAGTITVRDWSATPNEVAIAMAAGQIIPIRPQFVMATGTTGAYIAIGD